MESTKEKKEDMNKECCCDQHESLSDKDFVQNKNSEKVGCCGEKESCCCDQHEDKENLSKLSTEDWKAKILEMIGDTPVSKLPVRDVLDYSEEQALNLLKSYHKEGILKTGKEAFMTSIDASMKVGNWLYKKVKKNNCH